jgi:hypothetical protein
MYREWWSWTAPDIPEWAIVADLGIDLSVLGWLVAALVLHLFARYTLKGVTP